MLYAVLLNSIKMREIKFRGKGISGWNYGLLTHDTKIDDNYEWFISNKAGKPYAFVVYPTSIGQFTGFTDRNGNEIYEGDILQYSLGLQDYKIHVSIDEERGCWHLARDYKYSEILGNVFDNPELLGGVAQHSI